MRLYSILSVFLLLCVSSFVFTADAQARTVYLVVLYDTGNKFEAGKDAVINLFDSWTDQTDIVTTMDSNEEQTNKLVYWAIPFAGSSVSDKVTDALREIAMRVRYEDVVMFYGCCHGAYRKGSGNNIRHFFSNNYTEIYRQNIINEMKACSCHLKVLIADCCSVQFAEDIRPCSASNVIGQNINALMQSNGFYDIYSCKRNEYSVYAEGGGIFTTCLILTIGSAPLHSWEDLIQETALRTNESYIQTRNQVLSHKNDYPNLYNYLINQPRQSVVYKYYDFDLLLGSPALNQAQREHPRGYVKRNDGTIVKTFWAPSGWVTESILKPRPKASSEYVLKPIVSNSLAPYDDGSYFESELWNWVLDKE